MTDFKHRVAGLSPEKRALLELRLRKAQAEQTGSAIRARPRNGEPFPCSFAQQRLWLLDRMDPGKAFYNMAFHLRLHGALDAGALERALDALRERHEVLRTVFPSRGGEPVQVIQPFAPVPPAVVEAPGLDAAGRDAEVARLSFADANAPFDLERGPLMRATLVRLADDDHALLLTLHHIVSDGWSMGILARELGALYGAFAAGRESPLEPLEVQYADYAVWHRDFLSGAELERQERFWADALYNAPAALELPTDRPRPPVQSHRGATLSHDVPAEVAERVREVARAEGATLFPALVAAFRYVLGRHSGQRDVVLGTPVAGRTRTETEGLIGFFVNTLALRTPIEGDPTFRELVRREHADAVQALGHQDLPFDRVVDLLRVHRDPARNPLFQAMVSLQNVGDDALQLPGLAARRVSVRWASAKFDIMADVYDQAGGGLRVDLEYATDLFEASTARRIAEHLHRFLENASAAPDRKISEVPLMGPEERETVLSRWNRTDVEYPREATLDALFAEVAREHPDRVAVRFGGRGTTYAELDARANRAARRLRALGVEPGGRVGIAVERSAEVMVAVLAALKAGAAYVPLDPTYPADRLEYMASDARVQALAVLSDVPPALKAFAGPVLSFERDRAALDAEDASPLEAGTYAESTAKVIYTSGSTGRPKGVEVPHRGVVRLVRGADYADLAPGDVYLHVAPLAFDASSFELWAPMLNAGTLVVFPPERPSPELIERTVREEGVTTLLLSSGLFHQLVAWGLEGLRGLKALLTGGDILSVEHARRTLEALPATRLVNVYGPTENATFTSCHMVRPEDVQRPSIPIGPPISNTRVYVLDRSLRPCPVGVPGELCAAGDGLAAGYVGRPGLTAEKFRSVDFGDGRVERVYRTGDRARWLEDGTLEFLGRMDGQVKIRGYRIEPGEVEAALSALPDVQETVVVAREDVPGDRRLVAYLTPRGGRAPAAAELREALRRTLPEFMVPSAFVVLPSLPLTTSGKVDKKALPAPAAERAGFAKPETDTEVELAGIWTELLGVARVGRHDNFFDLGGHSLSAMRLVTRLRETTGIDIPLARVFEAPTLAMLAGVVDAAEAAALAALLDELEGMSDDDLTAVAGVEAE
ncbi:MAG TPA: amino acid adenylation domain-containing protein [Longimicrobium sp.]|nr:amino acid adenylation domain-containing protein [Longimicrobium sp.]